MNLEWCLNSKNNGRGDCNTRWSLVLELMRGIGRTVCCATLLCNRRSVKKINVGHSDLLSSRRHTRIRYDVIDLGNVSINPTLEPELEYMHLKLTNEGVIIARKQTLFDGTQSENGPTPKGVPLATHHVHVSELILANFAALRLDSIT